eukprot:m51a1_g10371 putative translation initiation factor sui1 family protein (109) ;mRNA; r:97428-98188
MSIVNLAAKDPFADSEELGGKGGNHVHIRIQQRNGKKALTTISGLPQDLDFERILKHCKKSFSCNGSIVEDEELGMVIQLQGDQRQNVAGFLTGEGIAKKSNVKIHGF